MQAATPSRNERLLNLLAGVYSMYRQDLSEFIARAWRRAMEPYDIDLVEAAFDAHMHDPDGGQFLPKPADIVKKLQGTKADRSALAWSKVLDATQRVGAYSTVAFDDPAIHCAIEDLGGWPKVCRANYDELPFLERRFVTSYQAHQRAGSPHPKTLLGDHDQQNLAKNYKPQPVVLIGNQAAAQAVLQGGGAHSKTQIGVAKHVLDALPLGRA